MRFQPSITALAAAIGITSVMAAPAPDPQGIPPPFKCNADNVLRALRRFSTEAAPFCQTYTQKPATTGQPYPTYLRSYTTASSRISSACSCLNGVSPPRPTLGPYVEPSPTETITGPGYWPIQTTYTPTISAAPLALQTQAVVDGLPPTPEKIVFYGALGADNKTCAISHIDFKGPDDYPLVNLGDLIPGLAEAPICGANSINLKFTNVTVYNAASTAWAGKKFTLMTPGGDLCGSEGTHNFFRVESTSFRGNTLSATLSTTQFAFENAIESFDASYGTVSIEKPIPAVFKRSLLASHEKRGISLDDLDIGDIWDSIVSALQKTSYRVRVPIFDIDTPDDTVIAEKISGGEHSLNVHCNNCGFDASVGFFGQVSFDITKWEMVGLVMGIDLNNIKFDIDLGIEVQTVITRRVEAILATFAPYSIDFGDVLALGPSIQLIAAMEFKVDLAFQIYKLGFSGEFDTWDIGYNLVTKKPVVSGLFRPSRFTPLVPKFTGGVTGIGLQGGEVSLWLGPRARCGIKIAGKAVAEASIEVQFPNIRASSRWLPKESCPPHENPLRIPHKNDRCTHVLADARTRAVARAYIGKYNGALGTSYTLFEHELAKFVDENFPWYAPSNMVDKH